MELKDVGYLGLTFTKGPVTGWVFQKQTEYDIQIILMDACEKEGTEQDWAEGEIEL